MGPVRLNTELFGVSGKCRSSPPFLLSPVPLDEKPFCPNQYRPRVVSWDASLPPHSTTSRDLRRTIPLTDPPPRRAVSRRCSGSVMGSLSLSMVEGIAAEGPAGAGNGHGGVARVGKARGLPGSVATKQPVHVKASSDSLYVWVRYTLARPVLFRLSNGSGPWQPQLCRRRTGRCW